MKRLSIYAVFKLSLVAILFCFYGCSTSKFIPENSYLLEKNKIEKNSKEISEDDLINVLEQDANKKILGMKISMRVYCLSSPKSSNWLNRFIRRQGEAPVLYDPNFSEKSKQKMLVYLNSKGCFNSKIGVSEKIEKNKATVLYTIEAGKRYRIKEINCKAQDTNIQRLLNIWKDQSKVKKGDYYDESALTQERDKITTILMNNGYYGFNKESIFVQVDTSFQSYQLTAQLTIANPQVVSKENPDSLIEGKHNLYYVNNVYVYPNTIYSLKPDTIQYDTSEVSIFRKDRNVTSNYIFYSRGRITLNPKTVLRNTFIDPGELYNLSHSDQTYSGITSLRNFRLVNVDYRLSADTLFGKHYVDAYIRMIRNKVNNVSTSLELNNTSPTNSSNSGVGNLGIEWNLRYQNKNFFGNGEIFSAKYRFAVDFPKAGSSDDNGSGFLSIFNTFETGINVGIDIPKFLIPLRSTIMPRYFRPRTSFNVGFNYQYRTEYERNIPSLSFGYKWRGNEHIEHGFFPFELNAVNINIIKDTFSSYIAQVNDPKIKAQYTTHMISDTRYSFAWTNQDPLKAVDFTALMVNTEVAGNIFYLGNSLANSPKDEDGNYTILGLPYAQYVRLDMDLKHYFYFNKGTSLVLRGYLGTGFTYGNSLSMPYEKSFFAGGPSNIRGWRLKALGPGGFQNLSNTPFDKTGDISMCLNIESRFPLFSVFEGAAFIDAGNTWLQRPSEEFPDGNFEFNTFYKQIGVSAGLGLRLNISFFIFRFDFAARLRDPARDEGDYWMVDKLHFSDIVFSFGIGYPF